MSRIPHLSPSVRESIESYHFFMYLFTSGEVEREQIMLGPYVGLT
jgi:hypothetical protein